MNFAISMETNIGLVGFNPDGLLRIGKKSVMIISNSNGAGLEMFIV
jgi:hypothetical protein